MTKRKPYRRQYTKPVDSMDLIVAPIVWISDLIDRWLSRRKENKKAPDQGASK